MWSEFKHWGIALFDVLQRTRAVPRLIVLPQSPGTALVRCVPLILLIVMVASALFSAVHVEILDFTVATGLAVLIGGACAWVASHRPTAEDSAFIQLTYRWLYMLVAVFVGALGLFVVDTALAYALGHGNGVAYVVASLLWPGAADLFDPARFVQFLIYAVVAWGFYAAFFRRPALPADMAPPGLAEKMVAAAAATLSAAAACAVLLNFGVEVLLRWIDAIGGMM